MSAPLNIVYTELEPDAVEALHKADAAIFPNKLALQTLLCWQIAQPDLFVQVEATDHIGKRTGVLCLLGIHKTFHDALMQGQLEECDIMPDMLVPRASKDPCGYHVWHIENNSGKPKTGQKRTNFMKAAFTGLVKEQLSIAASLQSQSQMTVSALTATDHGQAFFEKQGFESCGTWDYIVKGVDGQSCVRHSKTPTAPALAKGEELIRACNMMRRSYDCQPMDKQV
ncbi:hypothetical protein BCR37DRAFT_155488 [Protomyces lactucae-debilis]|uniref:Uncharacterized protein n=1 Tax=Protomyces lactucae-debilis TaxID=2754530 RepID=A0A1Y2F0J8_PROLT|nr:uncharacterized protein BCR37DRAFT_155488 [Protomyces lactucae-debilis]ORY77408.1 hypothetical protein BCR37DRAFT_155488 [Protomyces lactucae-debilis]